MLRGPNGLAMPFEGGCEPVLEDRQQEYDRLHAALGSTLVKRV
jgi:hypothetical protein